MPIIYGLAELELIGGTMPRVDKGGTVTMQELVASSLVQTDALTKHRIEKGVMTQDEFMQKLSAERAVYREMLGKMG